MAVFAVAVQLSSTYKNLMLGHRTSTTYTMQGPSHLIMTLVKPIVIDIFVNQAAKCFFFFAVSF